jgi:hypothetical protein
VRAVDHDLKATNAFCSTIPPSFLERADEVVK